MTDEELLDLANTARFDADANRANAARLVLHDALLELLPEAYGAMLARATDMFDWSPRARAARVVLDPEGLLAAIRSAPARRFWDAQSRYWGAFRIDAMIKDGTWMDVDMIRPMRLEENDVVTFALTREECLAAAHAARVVSRRRRR